MAKAAPIQLPETFHDARGDGYWIRLPNGRYLSLGKRDIAIHLQHAGLCPDEMIGNMRSIDRAFLVCQTERSVDYAGPICGHPCGSFKTRDGKLVLVTSEARIPTAEKRFNSSYEFTEKFFGELFGPDQTQHVLYWLKSARAAQQYATFRPGQMVCLAGPSACGKSLWQSWFTAFIGGRVGKPYRYMIGETAFNSDVCSAEHWCIEDENASTDIRARRKFGASIKESTVNLEISLHAKGREAITLPMFRRVTLSVNDESENLMIIPPLDGSIMDKIHLFKCGVATIDEDRKKVWDTLMAELPAFCHFLSKVAVPKKWKCPRFGSKSYHNPELLEILSDMSQETKLMAYIDEVLWKGHHKKEWTDSAEELERVLRGSNFSIPVDRLLHYPSACGVFLGRLARRFPERFTVKKYLGKNRWKIVRPKLEPIIEED